MYFITLDLNPSLYLCFSMRCVYMNYFGAEPLELGARGDFREFVKYVEVVGPISRPGWTIRAGRGLVGASPT